jgi:hypothetical protein
MSTLTTLPEGYREIYSVDLAKNKKTALFVNLFSIALALVVIAVGGLVVSIKTLFDMSQGLGAYFLRFAALFAFMIIYVVLHELVHAVVMKSFGTKKVKCGFKGIYGYAGSDDYYNKLQYITIALAPVILWGVVIAVINFFVPAEWFWVVYLIQVFNVSGAAGDMFVVWKFSRMPKDILVRDYGVGMHVYSKTEQ